MAEEKYLSDTPLQIIINDNVALATATRAAADYDNSTELDLECDIFLQVQYDVTAPTAGDAIANLWILPGDGEVTEVFPEGGDAGLGTDNDPQSVLFVGTFISINPSITVNEILCLPSVKLYPHGNRFVLKNISGQTFDLTWELRIKPRKFQWT